MRAYRASAAAAYWAACFEHSPNTTKRALSNYEAFHGLPAGKATVDNRECIPLVSSRASLSAPGHLTARLADWLLAGPPTTELEEFPLTLLPVTCSFSFLYAGCCVTSPARPSRQCPVTLSTSRSSSEERMISRILAWSQTCSTVFALLPPFHRESLNLCCAHAFTEFYALGELLAVRVHICVGARRMHVVLEGCCRMLC